MIGLPLRLLAREVYDRVTRARRRGRVALVTGEEQRVPRAPVLLGRTVEAMPVDREVDFLAVDEVQLAAHEQRGHVFTSRVLSARGAQGDVVPRRGHDAPVLRELVPTARQVEHPRLSRLAYAGAGRSRACRREARSSRSRCRTSTRSPSGCARARAARRWSSARSRRGRATRRSRCSSRARSTGSSRPTPSAWASTSTSTTSRSRALRKFDGREVREVDAAELAQIAGRAGRWVAGRHVRRDRAARPPGVRRARHRDPPLPAGAARALAERRAGLRLRRRAARRRSHVPPPRACSPWRAAPRTPRPSSRSRRAEVARARARRGARAPALGRVHRAGLPEAPARGARRAPERALPRARAAAAARPGLDRGAGARDRTTRPATSTRSSRGSPRSGRGRTSRTATRVVESPREWQERTRAIEDRLSDALHERLVQRFVDAKKGRARGPGTLHAPSACTRARKATTLRTPLRSRRVIRSRSSPRCGSGSRLVAHAHAGPTRRGSRRWWRARTPSSPRCERSYPSRRAGRASARSCAGPRSRDPTYGSLRRRYRCRSAAPRPAPRPRVRARRRVELLGGHAMSRPRAPSEHVDRGFGGGARPRASARAGPGDDADPRRRRCLRGARRGGARRARSARDSASVRSSCTCLRGSWAAAIAARIALATTWFGAGRALRPPSGGAVSFPAGRGIDRRVHGDRVSGLRDARDSRRCRRPRARAPHRRGRCVAVRQ